MLSRSYCEKENGSQKPSESQPSSRRAAPCEFISGFRPFSTRRAVKTGRGLSRSYCEKGSGSQKPAESLPNSRRATPSKFISGFRPFSTRRAIATGRVLSRSYCEKENGSQKTSRKPAQQPAGGPEQVYFRFSAVLDAQGSINRPGAILKLL